MSDETGGLLGVCGLVFVRRDCAKRASAFVRFGTSVEITFPCERRASRLDPSIGVDDHEAPEL